MKQLQWIIIAMLLMAGGCTSAKITTLWKADNAGTKQYKKILVLGLVNDKDRQIRERMEDHFVGDLTDMGYTAVSALQQYGPKAFEGMDEKTAIEKIKNSGADAVITIVLLDKEKERRYVAPQPIYRRYFWDYYDFRYGRIYEPGYYVTSSKYFWESNFYDLTTQQLLYSVQTKSFSPASTEAMSHEYGQLIVKNMVKQKILERQNNVTGQ